MMMGHWENSYINEKAIIIQICIPPRCTMVAVPVRLRVKGEGGRAWAYIQDNMCAQDLLAIYSGINVCALRTL